MVTESKGKNMEVRERIILQKIFEVNGWIANGLKPAMLGSRYIQL